MMRFFITTNFYPTRKKIIKKKREQRDYIYNDNR